MNVPCAYPAKKRDKNLRTAEQFRRMKENDFLRVRFDGREAEGLLPGALIIERNVLEWRFDPSCDARLPIADYDLQIIVVCQEGYTSSLAAASLQDLGIHQAADVIGGYAAWRELLRKVPRCVSQHRCDNAPVK